MQIGVSKHQLAAYWKQIRARIKACIFGSLQKATQHTDVPRRISYSNQIEQLELAIRKPKVSCAGDKPLAIFLLSYFIKSSFCLAG
jgi:hypothetical protein